MCAVHSVLRRKYVVAKGAIPNFLQGLWAMVLFHGLSKSSEKALGIFSDGDGYN
ncbi:hypothetical protein QBC45DRAFT_394899 [Copromyces sp. CBS 386.78]|nr:hypothetical protein QBC45DRAFT_394899 [Copromyces sp. CBS 386.78]